ncbi:hypothetical protein FPY71_10040 [Aureimonas fodinaquatilis]|uniref:Dit-like phage tail protein N-terminal domain-containing protein n=1 Tax=Aureimonas fodinaquatilis TaxID=2565783 RepID=A0A5B0DWD1_9HYPH|nr:hypothetical protein [Aureimonas fodinaquatilis]KAA0970806.1 hypothetical protein FPY71_10040 [Aureimonas fodinaquatilis]
MTAIAFSRLIGPVSLDVIIREQHETELEITLNPVEASADITDHAYMQPRRLVMEVADRSAAATWQALRRLQESRVPFTMVSGLDIYRNLLIRRLTAERDATYSQVFRGTVELQEVILVDTAQAAASDSSGQRKSERGGKADPGGKDSRRSAAPTSERSGDRQTSDRASSTVQRGDSATKPVEASRGSSLLYSMFGE